MPQGRVRFQPLDGLQGRRVAIAVTNRRQRAPRCHLCHRLGEAIGPLCVPRGRLREACRCAVVERQPCLHLTLAEFFQPTGIFPLENVQAREKREVKPVPFGHLLQTDNLSKVWDVASPQRPSQASPRCFDEVVVSTEERQESLSRGCESRPRRAEEKVGPCPSRRGCLLRLGSRAGLPHWNGCKRCPPPLARARSSSPFLLSAASRTAAASEFAAPLHKSRQPRLQPCVPADALRENRKGQALAVALLPPRPEGSREEVLRCFGVQGGEFNSLA